MAEPVTWIDSHAHLSMFDAGEVESALDRAAARNIRKVLVPATGGEDLEPTIALAEDHPGIVVAAVGVHPHESSTLDAELKRAVESALDRPGVVAVGEIGLDYHYMNSPREDQLAALGWHLDLAVERGLPVVLHNRESWIDLEAALSRREGTLRGVCHSFTEGPAEARRVLDLGLEIGISGMVTFKAAENIRETASSLDPDRVLVETDSPFLAPVPYRGGRNEPSYVPLVGGKLAELWDISVDQVAARTSAVFERLFSC